MKKLTVGSLFAGVGGTCIGFKDAGCDVIWANELDANAAKTYRENFPDTEMIEQDITTINPEDLKKVDILLAGFPCQAFSIAGYRKGFEDERGNLFFDVIRLAKVIKPKVIFLENVKNLQSHDGGNTYKVIKETLEAHHYHVTEKIMNSMEYGNVPQNRERIYVVAFKNEKYLENFSFPEPIERTVHLKDIIDQNESDQRFFYTPGKYPIYDEMIQETVKSQETCYQIRRVYVRENKSNVCPTLTANMGTGGHNVPLILTDKGVRKLTPRECFRLQGFPDTYKFPEKMSLGNLYKQSGNSVTAPVIKRIAQQILLAMQQEVKHENSELLAIAHEKLNRISETQKFSTLTLVQTTTGKIYSGIDFVSHISSADVALGAAFASNETQISEIITIDRNGNVVPHDISEYKIK